MNTVGQPWSSHSPLKDVPAAVNQRLSQHLEESQSQFSYINPLVTQAIDVLADFINNGGKRVRPTFCWAGFRAGHEESGTELSSAAALTAISSLEFIQACALIHDDIIDKSDTRRGHATVHRVFEADHAHDQWSGPSEHYGISQAILLGDLALAWADDMFFGSGLPTQVTERALEAWRSMRTEVIAGQMLDIALEANGSESVKDSMDVITYKTASYTVSRPLHLGAVLAGASPSTIERLRTIGHHIGVAFQLRDDQLGVFGDPDVTGKPSGDDLRSGKRTTLINFALEKASTGQASTLRKHLGAIPSGDAGHKHVDVLRDIIQATGAAQRVETSIEQHSERAVELITSAGFSPQLTEEMIQFATVLTHRAF